MGKFADQFNKSVDKAYKKVSETASGATILLFSSIVYDSPVDTGALRANWIPTIGSPSSDKSDSTSVSGNETVSIIQETVQAGQINYLVNNLPYAPIIEYGLYPNPSTAKNPKTANGYSTQAPGGMVSINVHRWDQYLKTVAER